MRRWYLEDAMEEGRKEGRGIVSILWISKYVVSECTCTCSLIHTVVNNISLTASFQ